ncbi:MAG: glycosyltransferase [Planctomycetota bacterium]
MIGRINSWKGQPVAVEAMALLHRRRPDLRLAIVGGPPPGQEHFETSLDARIAEAGLGEAILRGRFTPEVADLYRAADLILVPSSRPEPFGLVTLEAFAAGRAALVSGHGGPTEIVERGVTGDWFEPDNAQDLADRLLALIEDPRTLQAMGQRARRVQKLRFSLASHVARFQRLYQILPDSCQHMDRSSGLGDTPRIIHAVLGRANPARMNGVNRVVHGLASRQSLRMPIEVWGLCEHPDAPTPPRPYRLVTWPRSKRRRRLAPGLLGELDRITSWPPSQRPIFHLHGAFLPEWSTLSKELRARGLEYVFTAHGAYVPAALGKGRLRKAPYRRLFETRLVRGARSVQALSPKNKRRWNGVSPAAKSFLVPPARIPNRWRASCARRAGADCAWAASDDSMPIQKASICCSMVSPRTLHKAARGT